MYEVLLQRKTQLDQLVEGLSCLGFVDFLGTFKEELSDLFVGGMKTTVDDLLRHITIVPHVPTDGTAAKTYQHFIRYVEELNENGKSHVIIIHFPSVCDVCL